MPLTSYSFLFIFLPIAVLLNLVTKGKHKYILLAMLNFIFIGYLGIKHLILITISMLTYYYGALLVADRDNHKYRKSIFWSVIVFNVIILVFFKYKPAIIATTQLTILEKNDSPHRYFILYVSRNCILSRCDLS